MLADQQAVACRRARWGHQQACCPQHSHDKSNSVTGRDRRSATNGECVPFAEVLTIYICLAPVDAGCRRLAVSYLPPTPAWSYLRSSDLNVEQGRESAQSR